jgi:hypothetical protein
VNEEKSHLKETVREQWKPAGAAPRSAVVLVLGDAGTLTLQEIERAAGAKLAPERPPASIEEYLDELITVGLVEPSEDHSRFELTPAGVRRYNGILALSRG